MEYRPCVVREIVCERDSSNKFKKEISWRKGLFHGWSHKQWIHEAVICGDVSGQMSKTVAIVEYEDGSIHEHFPCEIKFTDGMVKKFCKKQAETVIGTNERYENAKK